MIPNHVLDELTPDKRIAVLSQNGKLHFLVHLAGDDAEAIRMQAERDGSKALATHLKDKAATREYVATLEPDVGGEG
jgi:hypothetical protein